MAISTASGPAAGEGCSSNTPLSLELYSRTEGIKGPRAARPPRPAIEAGSRSALPQRQSRRWSPESVPYARSIQASRPSNRHGAAQASLGWCAVPFATKHTQEAVPGADGLLVLAGHHAGDLM